MDINTIQNANAYLNSNQSSQAQRDALINETNQAAARTDVTRETADMVKNAFNVDISEQGRQQLAAASDQETQQQGGNQDTGQTQNREPGGGRLVNIVA